MSDRLWIGGDPRSPHAPPGPRRRRRGGDEPPRLPESAPPHDEAPPVVAPPLRRRVPPAVAGAVVVAALAGVLMIVMLGGGEDEPARDRGSAAALPAAPGGAAQGPSRVGQIYRRASAGVVSVRAGRGSGTGFVIDRNGTIVTNAHVVGGADRVRVRFEDGGRYLPAELVGDDASSDLAVLRIAPSRAPRLVPLPLANSDQVEVGDQAVAIGFPLGLDRTATAGIVSGTKRKIQAPNGFSIDEVIQTDAPINPGNSGGPLLDARARVIGVNSQIASAGSAGNIGIGFAVPSNTVREIVPRLLRDGRIDRPYLGVSTTNAPGGGAAVARVEPGGPAEQAGLQGGGIAGLGGDVITELDGRRIEKPDDVASAIEGKMPGDRVRVEVERDGRQLGLEVELGSRPERRRSP